MLLLLLKNRQNKTKFGSFREIRGDKVRAVRHYSKALWVEGVQVGASNTTPGIPPQLHTAADHPLHHLEGRKKL